MVCLQKSSKHARTSRPTEPRVFSAAEVEEEDVTANDDDISFNLSFFFEGISERTKVEGSI